MANKDHTHNNRSVCELSMLLVANIIRLSSVRLSGLSFTKNLPPPQAERTHVPVESKGNTTSVSRFSNKSERSQEPERTKSPMKPIKEDPTFVVRQEQNDVDVNAENYISQIRGKIGKSANIDTTAAAENHFSSLPSSSSIVK